MERPRAAFVARSAPIAPPERRERPRSTGEENLPFHITLHESDARHGHAGDSGRASRPSNELPVGTEWLRTLIRAAATRFRCDRSPLITTLPAPKPYRSLMHIIFIVYRTCSSWA